MPLTCRAYAPEFVNTLSTSHKIHQRLVSVFFVYAEVNLNVIGVLLECRLRCMKLPLYVDWRRQKDDATCDTSQAKNTLEHPAVLVVFRFDIGL